MFLTIAKDMRDVTEAQLTLILTDYLDINFYKLISGD
jgi:hypothetical protein